MRVLAIITTLSLSLVIAACSKPTQEKTAADLKAVGAEVSDAAKDVAAAPAVEAVGDDIRQGASEAAAKTKEVAAEAADKTEAAAAAAADKTKSAAATAGEKLKAAGSDLKAGAQKAGAEIKAGAQKADAKVDDALN